MKKIALTALIVLGIVLGLNIAAERYKYELHAAAIDFETRSAGLSLKKVEINGEYYAYYSSEEKPKKFIMIHGFSANKSHWARYAKHFVDEYQVIVPDMKGHGDNKRDFNDNYQIEDQVAFLKAFNTELGIDKFHVAGNSMGGAIAILYAATYPDEVETATLISPAGVHDIPSVMDKMLEEGVNPLVVQSAEDFPKLIDFTMSQPPYMPSVIASVEAEIAVDRAEINTFIFSQLTRQIRSGLSDRLATVTAPTLFIWGDEDKAINVENLDKFAASLNNATKLVMQGVGHLAMIEVPSESASATLEFIKAQQ